MTRQLGSCTVKTRVLACILVATGPGPRQIEVTSLTLFYERSNSGYAIKPKKTVKRQTDTKMQWNTLQVSLFYSFHLRKVRFSVI